MSDRAFYIPWNGVESTAALKVVDVVAGVQAGTISPRGKVVSQPIVNGNTASVVVELPDGTRMGTVHSLPGGSMMSQFRA